MNNKVAYKYPVKDTNDRRGLFVNNMYNPDFQKLHFHKIFDVKL